LHVQKTVPWQHSPAHRRPLHRVRVTGRDVVNLRLGLGAGTTVQSCWQVSWIRWYRPPLRRRLPSWHRLALPRPRCPGPPGLGMLSSPCGLFPLPEPQAEPARATTGTRASPGDCGRSGPMHGHILDHGTRSLQFRSAGLSVGRIARGMIPTRTRARHAGNIRAQ